MVYVDELKPSIRSKNWPYIKYCHMFADTLDELHSMADKIGLRRSWFQDHDKRVWLQHYDLTQGMRRKALAAGAIFLSAREWIKRHLEYNN